MGSHSYLQNLNSCAGLPANVRQFMQCSDTLQNLYIKGEDSMMYEQPIITTMPVTTMPVTTVAVEPATTNQYYLIPDATGVYQIVENPLATTVANNAEDILIPTMPAPSGARPWTQESWNEWNLLEHNGTAHPDRVFSQQYGFEPYLI